MTDLDQPYHGTPSTEPLWGSLRKPGEPPAPTMSEWVAKIAAASTPKRELVDGRFVGWINPRCICGLDGAMARGDTSFVRLDVVCQKPEHR